MASAGPSISRWNTLLSVLAGTATAPDDVELANDDISLDSRFARAKFRAWHRGMREADYMIGSYFDHHHNNWSEAQLAWFEDLLEEDDVDVMGWALKAQPVPERLLGPQMTALQRLDYVKA